MVAAATSFPSNTGSGAAYGEALKTALLYYRVQQSGKLDKQLLAWCAWLCCCALLPPALVVSAASKSSQARQAQPVTLPAAQPAQH